MRHLLAIVLLLALLGAACGDDDTTGATSDTQTPSPSTAQSDDGAADTGDPSDGTGTADDDELPPPTAVDGVEQLVPQVVSRRAHDTTAFTQGLEFVGDRLFESTGIHGESTTGLREIDPDTGEVIRRTDLGDPAYFGEGITEVDGRIVMLTWQDGLAFAFDVETFALAGTYAYLTEGWGLCHDGTRLVMSDGTSTLTFRDEDDFSEIGTVQVTLDGVPLNQLNELECVGGDVWANVWLTDQIVRIDPTTGAVTGVVDGSGLVDPHPQTVDPNAVLNGIAWDPDAETFLVTGKLWPEMVEVRFVPTEIAPPAASPASVQGSAGCAAEPPSPGVETLTLVSGGLERSYRRFVPTGAGSEPMPLVLNFHGFTSTADQQADNSGFEELGEREGVIVVHPQGSVLPSLGLTYWNIGLGDAVGPDAVDDVAFVSELLDTLEAELCVDPSRVYATGLSNGGYFSGLLACELADRFAAVAGVAAIFHPDGCAPSRMIPVLELHGTADIVVPFEGGDSVLAGSLLADTAEDPATAALIDAFFGMSMPGEMAEWALADGCDGTEPPLDAVAEQVSVRRFTGCEVSVEHYVIDGGTHTWFTLDNGGIDATATVWEFFTRHRLGPVPS